MNFSRLALPLLLASLSASLVACSNPAGDDDSASDESDIKKKVSPKGGNGELDLIAPTAFKTDGFFAAFQFDNGGMNPGDKIQKVPGTYVFRSNQASFADGIAVGFVLNVPIASGTVVQQKLGGINIHYSEGLTLGSARIDLAEVGGSGGSYLAGGAAWQTKVTGSSQLVIPGTISVTTEADGLTSQHVVAENKLEEVILPVAHVAVSLDEYDSAYPTPTNCPSPTIVAGENSPYNYTSSATLRSVDGSTNAKFVVPVGTRAPVTVNSYGLQTTQIPTAGGTQSFTLNRLEVDDVEVAQTGGGSTFVKGTFTVTRKNADGTLNALNCTFATHSGIDLPDGNYTVLSRASTASGIVTSSQDVSFP